MWAFAKEQKKSQEPLSDANPRPNHWLPLEGWLPSGNLVRYLHLCRSETAAFCAVTTYQEVHHVRLGDRDHRGFQRHWLGHGRSGGESGRQGRDRLPQRGGSERNHPAFFRRRKPCDRRGLRRFRAFSYMNPAVSQPLTGGNSSVTGAAHDPNSTTRFRGRTSRRLVPIHGRSETSASSPNCAHGSSGRPRQNIATNLGVHRKTVTRCINACCDGGLDELRPEQPGRIPDSLADEVRHWAIDGPAKQGLDWANWTHEELADWNAPKTPTRRRTKAKPGGCNRPSPTICDTFAGCVPGSGTRWWLCSSKMSRGPGKIDRRRLGREPASAV